MATREQLQAYAQRWALVEEAERDELRATTMEEKFAQAAALMQSAISLGWHTTVPEEVAAVRARWNRLAAIYHRG